MYLFFGFFRAPAFYVGSVFQVRVINKFSDSLPNSYCLLKSNFLFLWSEADDNSRRHFSLFGVGSQHYFSDGLKMNMKHETIGFHKLSLDIVSVPDV